jgi:hypothetical protein
MVMSGDTPHEEAAMAATEELTGGCFCGAVRYRLTDRPMFVHCCHCRECQKRTGSAFVINALIETSRIDIEAGEPAKRRVPGTSGRPQDLYVCEACSTPLWSDYGAREWMMFVRVSSLDDPTAVAPDVHIFTASKVPWVQIPEGAMAVEEYYDMQAAWPAQSWDRLRAAKHAHDAG